MATNAGGNGTGSRGSSRLIVGNEFATVELTVDHAGGSGRAVLRDLRTGMTRHIDPIIFETLVWISEEAMEVLANPDTRVSL